MTQGLISLSQFDKCFAKWTESIRVVIESTSITVGEVLPKRFGCAEKDLGKYCFLMIAT